jgi:hypothetical protein
LALVILNKMPLKKRPTMTRTLKISAMVRPFVLYFLKDSIPYETKIQTVPERVRRYASLPYQDHERGKDKVAWTQLAVLPGM